MIKTQTNVEYAAFVKRKDGSWHKLNALPFKTQKEAERMIREHIFYSKDTRNVYKVMARTAVVTLEDWHDIPARENTTEKEMDVLNSRVIARNAKYEGFGEKHTAAEWARLFVTPRTSMWRYLKRGLTIEEIAQIRGIKYK